jgi:hypothetical protein
MMMFSLTRLKAALLGCGLAVASCLAMPASRHSAPVACVMGLPKVLGTWELVEETQLKEKELRVLEASDHWRRIYRCRETRQVIIVTWVVGPSGPLASHQPEVCYARHAFYSQRKAHEWAIPGRTDRFRIQTLEPRQIGQPALTVAYAWHDSERWRAPQCPRWQLAGHTDLQRIQVTMRHPSGMARRAHLAISQFLQLAIDAANTDRTHFKSRHNKIEGAPLSQEKRNPELARGR